MFSFLFTATAPTQIYTLSLHDALPISAGLKAGFDFARGDVIISMDGDLQHDPAEIPAFIAKIHEGYDIVSGRSEEHTSELQSLRHLVCRLLLEKKKRTTVYSNTTQPAR